MGISGIGAVGGIGTIGFRPYIYKVNSVSSSSLNRIKPIGHDVAKAPSTDYSELYDEGENINPLRKGQTKNFADILASQMAMSRLHAERVMAQAPTASASAVQETSAQTAAVPASGGHTVAGTQTAALQASDTHMPDAQIVEKLLTA